jgi:hypothetical protein
MAIAKDIGFIALIFWPLALTWGFPFGPGPGVLAWLLGGLTQLYLPPGAILPELARGIA